MFTRCPCTERPFLVRQQKIKHMGRFSLLLLHLLACQISSFSHNPQGMIGAQGESSLFSQPLTSRRNALETMGKLTATTYSASGEEKEYIDTESTIDVVPKMVVFDKDGTLSDQLGSLILWVDVMTNHLSTELACNSCGANAIEKDVGIFHKAIGWDEYRKCFVPSAHLAAGTWQDQIDTCENLFGEMGISEPRKKATMWHESIGSVHDNDAALVDLLSLMKNIKTRNLMVAIATSDDRKSTNNFIQNNNLQEILDFSICGDEVRNGKPSADPMLILCERAGVDPSECIMVGDTTADTGMAKNAGAGLMVGVLTGSGTRGQLLNTGADIVLDDVGQIPDLLNSMGIQV